MPEVTCVEVSYIPVTRQITRQSTDETGRDFGRGDRPSHISGAEECGARAWILAKGKGD